MRWRITHSLCTLEFQDNRRLYDWVLDNISIDCHPRQYEFSRLNLEYTIMSKRKLNQLVTEKVVEGWDDPRMPTISGLRRRGYTAASIREFCRRIGVTKQDNNVEMMSLESCIRDDLNEHAPRAMAVLDPIKVVIENRAAGEEWLTMPNHPNNPEMGSRQVPFDSEIYIDRADFREEANKQYKRLVLGKEVRLRNAYVIKAERVEKDAEGNVTTLYCSYDAETLNKDPADGRKVKGLFIGFLLPMRCLRRSVYTIACLTYQTQRQRKTSCQPSTLSPWLSVRALLSQVWLMRYQIKPISLSVKVISVLIAVIHVPVLWCLTVLSAYVIPGRRKPLSKL